MRSLLEGDLMHIEYEYVCNVINSEILEKFYMPQLIKAIKY